MGLFNRIFRKKRHLYKHKEDIDLAALQQIIDDVENKRKSVPFVPLTLDNAEISFMPTKGYSFIGLDDGLWDCYQKEKRHIEIKQKLPVNAKNYHRIIQKDGKVERIESYIYSKLNVVYLAYYEGNRRYLFPFMPNGSEYPTYTFVSVYNDGLTTEVYHTNSSQIILQQYQQLNENETDIVIVNAVPKGKVPIQEHWYGKLIKKEHWEYKAYSSNLSNQTKEDNNKKRLMMEREVVDDEIKIFPQSNDRLKSIIQAVPITRLVLFQYKRLKGMTKEWKSWAWEMMEKGFQTPGIIQLAGEDVNLNQFEHASLIESILKELELEVTTDEVYQQYVLYIAHQVLDNMISAEEGLEILTQEAIDTDYHDAFMDVYYLDDEIDLERNYYCNNDKDGNLYEDNIEEWMHLYFEKTIKFNEY